MNKHSDPNRWFASCLFIPDVNRKTKGEPYPIFPFSFLSFLDFITFPISARIQLSKVAGAVTKIISQFSAIWLNKLILSHCQTLLTFQTFQILDNSRLV